MADRTLHQRLYATAITTPITVNPPPAPLLTELEVPLGILRTVELVIPPGHAGLTGFALFLAGARILPFDQGTNWIIGDGATLLYRLDVQVDTQLVAQTYNTDQYPHTHYARLTVEDLPAVSSAQRNTGPIPTGDLTP